MTKQGTALREGVDVMASMTSESSLNNLGVLQLKRTKFYLALQIKPSEQIKWFYLLTFIPGPIELVIVIEPIKSFFTELGLAL